MKVRGDILKLDYFELLSPHPVQLQGVGGIVSPRLRDISAIGINTYHSYLSYLLMEPQMYFSMTGQTELYEQLTEEEKCRLTMFDLLPLNGHLAAALEQTFNFFIQENVSYSPEHQCFLIRKDTATIGSITAENHPLICDAICQRNYINHQSAPDPSKAKGKKTLEIMQKLQQGREQKSHTSKADQNMELGNIISAVAGRSQSLNLLNIWDLTVFQLWDCFARLSNNSIYDIQSMSVAAWGDKDHHFDAAAWFKRI